MNTPEINPLTETELEDLELFLKIHDKLVSAKKDISNTKTYMNELTEIIRPLVNSNNNTQYKNKYIKNYVTIPIEELSIREVNSSTNHYLDQIYSNISNAMGGKRFSNYLLEEYPYDSQIETKEKNNNPSIMSNLYNSIYNSMVKNDSKVAVDNLPEVSSSQQQELLHPPKPPPQQRQQSNKPFLENIKNTITGSKKSQILADKGGKRRRSRKNKTRRRKRKTRSRSHKK